MVFVVAPAMLIVVPLVAVAIVAITLALLARFVHSYAAIGLGAVGVFLFAYFTINGHLTCSAEPIYHPPEPGSDGEGMFEFPCDAPGAMLYYPLLYVVSPAAIICLCWLTFWVVRGENRRKAIADGAQRR